MNPRRVIEQVQSGQLSDVLDSDEREVLMALSQAYLEWEQTTEQRGIRAGKASLILTLLNARLGAINSTLATEIQSLSSEHLTARPKVLTAMFDSSDRLLP